MTITSWNINGVKNKLENKTVETVLSADIICLNEIKTDLGFSMPGYVTHISKSHARHRGGCAAVLLRHKINDLLLFMDNSHDDCIYFRLKCCPAILFICCYIPPMDSPYFCMQSCSQISSLIQAIGDDEILLIGDMNCRYASLRRSFVADKQLTAGMRYAESLDSLRSPTQNAKLLLTILKPLVLVNGLIGLSRQFPNDLTVTSSISVEEQLIATLISITSSAHIRDSSYVISPLKPS